jgi:hypothetical protein
MTRAADYTVRERLEKFSGDYYTSFLNLILVLRIRVTYRLGAGGFASYALFISSLYALCNPNNVARSQVYSSSGSVAFHTVAVFTSLAFSCSRTIIVTCINNAADKYLVKIPPFKCPKQANVRIM